MKADTGAADPLRAYTFCGCTHLRDDKQTESKKGVHDATSHTNSKSKCYIQSATCNELHYYEPSVVVTYGLRIGITTISLSLFLSVSAYAQPAHIPDPNLRSAVRAELKLPADAAITQEDIRRLKHLSAYRSDIINLSGLEFAKHLEDLVLGHNPITDLRPLTGLTNLRRLIIPDCQISDISPLSGLGQLVELNVRENPISNLEPLAVSTRLKYLDLSHCQIVDVTPIGNLINLEILQLNHNQIADIQSLALLSSLKKLEIQNNLIADHSPLDSLSLDTVYYDQLCEMPPIPLAPRLANRTYPSIFTRWRAPIRNRPDLTMNANAAHHDLDWYSKPFELRIRQLPDNTFDFAGDLDRAIEERNQLLTHNPNRIDLVDVGMRAAPFSYFPEASPYWVRDEHGNIVVPEAPADGGTPSGLLDFTLPAVQDRIVEQAIAVGKCGLYDGIFFDYWAEQVTVLLDYRTLEAELHARDVIVQRIRANTRPNFLIVGNTNYLLIPRTAPFVNGAFMETVVPFDKPPDDWSKYMGRVENALKWFDTNLRGPRINALEGWAVPTEPPDSPTNLRWMRAFTTLGLTHSDGYVVFTEPEKWTHYWYDFWDAELGKPVGAKSQLHDEDISGLYIREFTNGWAVYNHSGKAQVITLPEEVQGVASGLVDTEHALPNLDGEMYLRVKPANPADVNSDGVVNILDLILVAQALSTNDRGVDVNGDGVVNVFDLVQVAEAIGDGGAAPSAYSPELSIISAADVEKWLALAQGLDLGDANFQRGIRFLQQLLEAMTPKDTALLPNYPNPFNPETWIPYHLAQEAEVAITIYDTKGTLVRRLALGNQVAGYYAEHGKAAYWDGRNERGEAVASGIYIYQFRAGDYAASRRMVIMK